ncbi:hypothetical protein ABH899_001437 [Paenibacillus sp. RC84]
MNLIWLPLEGHFWPTPQGLGKYVKGGWMKSVLLFRTLFILCFNMEALRHTSETVIPLTDVFGLLFHFGAIS